MNEQTIDTTFIVLTAADGKLLTDGRTYARSVAVPDAATAAIWREIDEADAPPDWDGGDAPSPVPRYSKYLVKLACQRRGLWEQVRAAIEAAGKWESFLIINDISSDNPELLEALPAIRAAFGSDVVDAVLQESIASEQP